MAGAQFIQTLMLTGQFTKVKYIYKCDSLTISSKHRFYAQGEDDAVQANQIALEGVRSIKVVNAYSLQEDVCTRYSRVSLGEKRFENNCKN